MRLRIRARDVALAVGEPGLLSIRNRLAGTVAEIVDGPPPASTSASTSAARRCSRGSPATRPRALDLKAGQRVTALIKSVAFDSRVFRHRR